MKGYHSHVKEPESQQVMHVHDDRVPWFLWMFHHFKGAVLTFNFVSRSNMAANSPVIMSTFHKWNQGKTDKYLCQLFQHLIHLVVFPCLSGKPEYNSQSSRALDNAWEQKHLKGDEEGDDSHNVKGTVSVMRVSIYILPAFSGTRLWIPSFWYWSLCVSGNHPTWTSRQFLRQSTSLIPFSQGENTAEWCLEWGNSPTLSPKHNLPSSFGSGFLSSM